MAQTTSRVSIKRLLLTSKRPILFGMVHVKALPGTPLNRQSFEDIADNACHEADILTRLGVDGVVVENMNDVPYVTSRQIGPEITASMAVICSRIKQSVPAEVYLGLQILAGANQQAVAVALASGFDFIRAECFTFSHVADEGWMDACAGPLLRYRQQIGAASISVFTDIKKKHSAHAVTSDVSIVETAKAAEFFLSDGVIITGQATGAEANPAELKDVKGAVDIPVLVGSGVTLSNMQTFLPAHGFVVGSHFKTDGRWTNDLDPERVSRFIGKLHTTGL